MVVVGAAPAAHPVVAQAVCVVEVYLLCQKVEPNVNVLPKEDGGGHRLLLDFYGFFIIFYAVVLASADRLRLSYSIEGENLLVAVEAVQHSGDGAGLEHGAAPAHHSGGGPYVLADLQEGLVVVLCDFEDGEGVICPESFGIFGGVGKLQGCVAIDVYEAWIVERPCH